MQNKDYLLPGVAAIFVAVISPIYWLGMSQWVGDSYILGQDMMSLGFSDILFASILLLTIYIYLNLKNILNEQLNFNHIDLLVLIMVAINILWMSTLFLDVASAVLPGKYRNAEQGHLFKHWIINWHRCNCHIRYHRFVNRYFTSSEIN